MSFIHYPEKSDIDIKPVIQAIRLYALLNQFEEILVRKRDLEDLNNLYRRIKEEIKIISSIPHEENVVHRYFPIGPYLLDDIPKEEEILEYIRELSSSIEKGIMEISEAISTGAGGKVVSTKPPNMLFTYPIEKLVKGYRYIPGSRPCLISIPHAKPPLHDKGTLPLGREIASKTHCHLIYSTISRVYVDYNRDYSRLTPYRRMISKVIREENIKILIDLHGKEEDDVDIEIGWANGMTASNRTLKKLIKILDEHGITYKYEDIRLSGGDIIRYHSLPRRNEALQLEISYSARKKMRGKLVKAISKFITEVA